MHIINKIFSDFEKSKIKYCHFKSNQHLDESFEGISDYDVLVDSKYKALTDKILVENNCKRFEPEHIGAYPGVENWFAFDENKGVIFHIHLHYQIITGKGLVKDYVLPWKEFALKTAIKSSKWDIYISNPNFEILLLLSRTIVKSKFRDICKAYVGKYRFNYDLLVEYDYLKERIDYKELLKYANELFSPETAKLIYEFISKNDTINSKSFLLLSKLIRNEFKIHRRYNGFKAHIDSLYKRIIDLKDKFFSRKLETIPITKKVSTSGGKIIAFIGVDGSGKSTISYELQKWLGKKIECKKFYMGSGDGKKNLFATFASFIKKRITKVNTNKSGVNFTDKDIKTIHFKKEPKNYIKKYVHALVIYTIAKENRKKILKMHRYRLNGGFSILDRYPQLEHESINDGLKLKRYAKMLNSRLIKKLAQKEENLMQIVNEIYPDIVFRLNISPEVSMARKPDEHFDINPIKYKIECVKTLRFEGSNLIEVNAEKPIEEEILFIKRKIWECI